MSENEKNEESVMISLDALLADDPSLSSVKGSSTEELKSSISEANNKINQSELDRVGLSDTGPRGAPISSAALPVQKLNLSEKRSSPFMQVILYSFLCLTLIAGGVIIGKMLTIKDQDGAQSPPGMMKPPVQNQVAVAPTASVKKTNTVTKKSVDQKPVETKEESTKVAATRSKQSSKLSNTTTKSKRTKKKRSTKRSTRSTKTAVAQAPKPDPTPAAPPKSVATPKPKQTEASSLLAGLNRKGSAPNRPIVGSSAPKPVSNLPEKLSKRDVLNVLRKNQGSVKACAQHADPGTRIKVRLVIEPSGQVGEAALFEPSSKKGSPLEACVVKRVKRFRFPKFGGAPMNIKLPFVL